MIIATPIGFIADHYRHKTALLISSSVLSVGALIWANCFIFGGFYSLYTLYLAQLLLGLGTGSLGVTRSYVVEQTSPEERTNALSLLSSVQYAGFAATPLIGAGLVYEGRHISYIMGFSLPAYMVVLLSCICILLLVHPFKDIEHINVETSLQKVTPLSSQKNSEDSDSDNPLLSKASRSNSSVELLPNDAVNTAKSFQHMISTENPQPVEAPDRIEHLSPEDQRMSTLKTTIFYLMIFLNFSTRGALSVYETQLSQLLLGPTFQLSQLQLGITVTFAGLFGTFQLIYFKWIWSSHFDDLWLMCAGIIVVGLAQLFMVYAIVSTSNTGQKQFSFLWPIILSLYIVYGVGYPVANSAVLGVFSKLQKHGKQGFSQSLFAMAGSLARVIMPILSSYFETYVGAGTSFALVELIMLLSYFAIIYLQHGIQHYANVNNEELCYVSDKELITLSYRQIVNLLISATGIIVVVYWIIREYQLS